MHSTRKLTNIFLIKWDCLFLGGEVAVSSSSFILQGSSTHVGPYFIKITSPVWLPLRLWPDANVEGEGSLM